ncbi:MAG TPA: DUF2336 domain-containing protein [Vitreimonas sp.]|uniref:DUF2336 domain-containing protein n=1 Tax=Vitreimonas sp. TaxID=3069702 RepID=UPI002D28D8A2|nr:DUF2336 domain-containing protein [Vitreimonas sp.]HYD89178.1 DUF2336 domain-containing protein [Vitreimonas sp.]
MSHGRFAKLVELAKLSDSERRRDLLREVTDLFFETSKTRNARESALFDEVLQMVAAEMQDEVLAELSATFCDAADAPVGLLRDLANHSFEIAGPILRRSKVLDEQTLVQVVNYQSQAHIKAVAQREDVSETLSDAIVKFGDDHALDALLRNDGAKMSRAGMETAVDRARRNAMLHEGVVTRADMPLDLLNEMYFVVETRLRNQIMERNAGVDPATLDAALNKARDRMKKSAVDLSAEAKNAMAFIQSKKNAGELSARLLVSLWREAKQAYFLYGLAELTHVDHQTVAALLERGDIEGLAMICRAANIERPLFVTMAVLIGGGDAAMARAEEFGKMYNAVPVEAAQRAVRFFKVRKNAEDTRAA